MKDDVANDADPQGGIKKGQAGKKRDRTIGCRKRGT